MEQLHPFEIEHQRFIAWFQETHPEIHEKYARNIDYPLNEGGWVTVNNSFRISPKEVDMLKAIVRSYYNPAAGL